MLGGIDLIAAEFFQSLAESLPPPFNMAVLVVLIGAAANVVGVLATQARLYADHRAEERFKLDLIHSGLPPQRGGAVVGSACSRRQARRVRDVGSRRIRFHFQGALP